MKKLLLLLSIFLLSCSSSDDKSKKETPEKFDMKIEIIGNEGPLVQKINIVNSVSILKTWENVKLPFTAEYTYYTSGDENISSACNCYTIGAWAYLAEIHGMEKFNLYVDGVLVDSTTITNELVNGVINPTTVEFEYE